MPPLKGKAVGFKQATWFKQAYVSLGAIIAIGARRKE
jgi:hypothetical protein